MTNRIKKASNRGLFGTVARAGYVAYDDTCSKWSVRLCAAPTLASGWPSTHARISVCSHHAC